MTTTSTRAGHEVIGDRYHLLDRLSGTAERELWWADDARLGRAVLLRRHDPAEFPTRVVRRLLRSESAGVARVLDAGTAHDGPHPLAAYTVFPASDHPSLADVTAADWAATGVQAAAGVAAWLVALTVQVQARCGTTVAVSTDDVLVDPRVLHGARFLHCCPVQWMPAFSVTGDGDDLDAVVADLLGPATIGDRRGRRRVDAALTVLADPYGRQRAAAMLAGLAGLDPRRLGLPTAGPRHSDTGRRSSDRHLFSGIVPVTTRKELTCESAEAFS